jgi:hypothetical protein
MLAPIILIVLAIALIALFLKVAMGGWANHGGGSANLTAGATFDLMSQDQRKAMEVIIKKEAGEKEEEQESGEPEKKEMTKI